VRDPAVLQDWQSFYILVGSAAATLVGLMFVAMSVGSRAITPKDVTGLRVYASPTVVQFLYVLATSAVVLFPTLSRTLLGVLLAVTGLASGMRAIAGLPVMRRSRLDVHDWTWYFIAPSVSYLLFVAAGLGLLLRARQAATGLAVAMILLLVAGIRNAWDLIIYRQQPRDESPLPESAVGAVAARGTAEPQDPPPGTARRAAAPPPGPAAPQADAPRQSLALAPAQQRDVARIIEDGGLNARDFTWALQPSRNAMIGPPVSALVHTPTGCFFRFDFTRGSSGHARTSVYVPGRGAREVSKPAASWADQLEQVRDWVKRL
jgi:hypothetical protein